ncbi:hypothetical protein CN878_19500 [Ochrobactrum sp. 695/2009]|nr:hypothetical protein CN881_22165 [Ochrobactrum sp. 721/2009]PJT16937.1 hypothetical protein CN880_11555 [Ochrobactrum sp. 720/2009]PJT18771.1 hypothetical protein CN879_20705 [Ochrobactrum sp. 715/2009]PJT27961.1 hypothetical protein CN878_19500 [Ochrobactrum sp. 695/2009]PJT31953.1 hypothetical protein CN877_23240 [Ochrobactrum sp. 689/2009]
MIGLIAASNGWVAYIALAIAGALGLYLKDRADGKSAEKTRQKDESSAARSVADEIDAAIAGREADTNRERLSKWSR